MTNPNNAIGTPAAFKGRTSVKAYNNLTQTLAPGIISGWACAPVSGMTVAVGGSAGTRDVAVAEDASGNRTTISNISEAPVEVTITAAPSTYSRIDAIVAYVNPSPEGDQTTQDNPAACGICVAKGTAAANPTVPSSATIRSAITTDGGTGTTAYYVILATITVAAGTTSISSGIITQGDASLQYAQPIGAKDALVENTTTKSNLGNTWTDFYSYTITADGLYAINLNLTAGPIATSFLGKVRAQEDGTSFVSKSMASVANFVGNCFAEADVMRIRWFKKGTVIKVQGQNENATASSTIVTSIKRIV